MLGKILCWFSIHDVKGMGIKRGITDKFICRREGCNWTMGPIEWPEPGVPMKEDGDDERQEGD